jgi:glycosyltransferase involved in cell wall biosynthesis
MGQLDVLVIWPFAKWRRVPVVWDAFLSLYDTVVCDRKIINAKHPFAYLLFLLEYFACRAATHIVLDTSAHGNYFANIFKLKQEKIDKVFVGAEEDAFANDCGCTVAYDRGRTAASGNHHAHLSSPNTFTILFYGQFIPLHGVDIVVKAAKLTNAKDFRWVIIGKGQESGKIDALCEKIKPANLMRLPWVPYEELLAWINRADVGLGIFGATEKAQRVIPNKVFQLLMAGCPLITGDTPAARELITVSDMISLIPVADPAALAAAVEQMAALAGQRQRAHDCKIIEQITPWQIGASMLRILQKIVHKECV